jgi:hypothetical protein
MGKKEKGKSKGNSSETANKSTHQSADYHQDKKYSKRKLQTNWDKYEEPDEEINSPGLRGLNFAQFSNSNQKESGGSHFQFAQEKEWSDLPEKVSDYLKLDLKELSREILSVPLHERLRLEATYFSTKQIEAFERDAQMSKEKIRLDVSKLIPQLPLSRPNATDMKSPTPQEDELDSFLDSLEVPQAAEQPHNVWNDNSSNCLNLNSVSEELDLILAMPSTSIPAEG